MDSGVFIYCIHSLNSPLKWSKKNNPLPNILIYLFVCLFIYSLLLSLPLCFSICLILIFYFLFIHLFIYLFVYSLSPSYKKRHWQDSNLRSRWKLLSRQPPWPLGHNVLYNLGRLHGIKNNQSPLQSKNKSTWMYLQKILSGFLLFSNLLSFIFVCLLGFIYTVSIYWWS